MWYPSKVKHSSTPPTPPTPTIVTWADGTDAQIAAMIEAYYNDEIDLTQIWSVGDTRTVSLSAMEATGVDESHVAQDVELTLTNVGGKTLATPINGHTECVFQVDQINCLNELGYMNSTATNVGGWRDCARRTWCNSVYKNAIPSTLRGIFKEHINQSGIGNASKDIVNTTDTFAFRAEVEVTAGQYSVAGEGTHIEYYDWSAGKCVKKSNGKAVAWWNRSPRNTQASSFCNNNTNGARGYKGANTAYGLAPFGVI